MLRCKSFLINQFPESKTSFIKNYSKTSSTGVLFDNNLGLHHHLDDVHQDAKVDRGLHLRRIHIEIYGLLIKP